MTKMEQAVSSPFISRSSKSRQITRDSLYTSAAMLKNNDKILDSWVNKTGSYEEDNNGPLYSEGVEDESQRLSLDSGFGPDAENENDDDNQDDKEEASEYESNVSDREGGDDLTFSLSPSPLEGSMGQRKLQSILRAEPQIFVVRCDKKVVKKKKSKVQAQEQVPIEESLPRKRVEFLLENDQLSSKTSERTKKTQSHARRTFRHLKRKITGRNTSKIPLLPSIHSTHTMRHAAKHLNKAHAAPKTKSLSSPVLGRRARQLLQSSSSKQGLGVSDDDDDADYKTEDDEEVEEISSHEQEEDEEGAEDDVETDHDGEPNENDESDVDVAKKEENKVDDDEDEDDDYPKISRRKALSYHLRAIHLQQTTQGHNNNNKRKSKKLKPKFLTSGHGPGHAHHVYPKPLTKPTVASNDAKNDDHGNSKLSKKKNNKKRLTFKFMNKKSSQVTSPSSPSPIDAAADVDDKKEKTVNDNDIVVTKDADTKDDDILFRTVGGDTTATGQQKSSSQPRLLSVDFNQKFVGGLTRMLRANSEPKVQRRNSTPTLPRSGPARIVNTRYRSDFPCDEIPRFDF